MMKKLRRVLISLFTLYALVCLAVYVFQDSLIFPGARANPGVYYKHANHEIKLVNAGVTLQGWHVTNTNATDNTIILYFGGNAEDVANLLPRLTKLGAAHAYTFNYRGYGLSEGKPSQVSLNSDAQAIYDYVANLHRNQHPRFIIIGRSLGSAVAGQVANQRPIDKLILLTPLNSVAQSAQRALPFLPTSWLLRHPFDLRQEAEHFSVPVLMLIAEQDKVIPMDDSLATYAAINSEKQQHIIKGVGHNNLFANPEALTVLQTAIANLPNSRINQQ